MSADKVLEQWRRHIPKQGLLKDVLLVAEKYFQQVRPPKGGSHYILFDERIRQLNNLSPERYPEYWNGQITVVAENGRQVKGFYIKRMIGLIDLFDELERREAAHEKEFR